MSADTRGRATGGTATAGNATGGIGADTAVIKALRRIRMPQTGRNRELFLIIFALAITAAAVALVQLGALGAINWMFLVYVGAIAALVLGLHIVLRVMAPNADPFVVPIATVLTGLGIAMIYRIDIASGLSGWNSYATRQVAWTAIAVLGAIALVVVLRNYRVLFRYTYIAGLVAVVLLILPFIPGLGIRDQSAAVWVSIGGLFSFQPGELAKIALIGWIMAWHGGRQVLRFVDQTTNVLEISTAWYYAAIPIAGALILADALITVGRGIGCLVRGEDPAPPADDMPSADI